MLKFEKNFKNIAIIIGLILLLLGSLVGYYFIRENSLEKKYQNVAPTVELLGDRQVRLELEEEYKDAGFIATDARGRDISDNVVVSGEVDVSKKGTYLLYYGVKDRHGNESVRQSRIIIVGTTEEECDGNEFSYDEEEELIEKIKLEIEIHYQTMLEYGDNDCDAAQYLMPFVLDHYDEETAPKRRIVNSTIKEIWANWE